MEMIELLTAKNSVTEPGARATGSKSQLHCNRAYQSAVAGSNADFLMKRPDRYRARFCTESPFRCGIATNHLTSLHHLT